MTGAGASQGTTQGEPAPGTNRFFYRFIRTAERIGNVLPHPFTVFVILIGVVVGFSILLSKLGVAVSYVTIDGSVIDLAPQIQRLQNEMQKELDQQWEVHLKDLTDKFEKDLTKKGKKDQKVSAFIYIVLF